MKRIPAIIGGVFCVAVTVAPTPDARAYDPRDGNLERAVEASIARNPDQGSLGGYLRFEGGLGYNNGGTDTTVSSPGLGSVNTDLIGGGGVAAEAALWLDQLMGVRAVSVGAQYLYFDGSGSVTATSSAGPILGLTSATGKLGLTTNAMMFNAAWRPGFNGVHPYLGAGIGVAFGRLSGSALGFSSSTSQTSVAGQVFFGFDYDMTANLYAGLVGRFFFSDATYHAAGVNIDVTNRPISLLAHVGLRF